MYLSTDASLSQSDEVLQKKVHTRQLVQAQEIILAAMYEWEMDELDLWVARVWGGLPCVTIGSPWKVRAAKNKELQ